MERAIFFGFGVGLCVILFNYLWFVKVLPSLNFLKGNFWLIEIFTLGPMLPEFYLLGVLRRYLLRLSGDQIASTNDLIFLALVIFSFAGSIGSFVVIPAIKKNSNFSHNK